MVVSGSGQLYKMSMSGIGHWNSDASGNNYVGMRKFNIKQLAHGWWVWNTVTITTDYKLTMQHYNSSYGPDEKILKDWVNSPSYGDVL